MEYLESIAARYNVRVYNTEPLEDVVTVSVERGVQELAPSQPTTPLRFGYAVPQIPKSGIWGRRM
jgi:hypothetical protein